MMAAADTSIDRPTGDQMLIVGIRGDRGCLIWATEHDMLVPTGGINTAPADDFTRDGHHHPHEAGAEVPVDVMRRAVRECVDTGQRPTCVEWTDAVR